MQSKHTESSREICGNLCKIFSKRLEAPRPQVNDLRSTLTFSRPLRLCPNAFALLTVKFRTDYIRIVPRQVITYFLSFTGSHYTVVILINATTLLHRSTLIRTNNFGSNHFGQKYKKQNILTIFRRL